MSLPEDPRPERHIVRDALISDDGVYRYTLSRWWDRAPGWQRTPPAVWIMLNPSTADALVDDATTRRVMGFTRSWGFSGAVVLNLFALRARNPRRLVEAPDPVGPRNDRIIRDATPAAGVVVAGWGAHPLAVDRAAQVRELIAQPLMCLGRTKAGHPRHPLYLPHTATLEVL